MSDTTFLFEEALNDKNIERSSLPSEIEIKIKSLLKTCQKLATTDPSDDEALETLNSEIDEKDEAIANEISKLNISAPANPDPAKKETVPAEKDNTLATIGILGVIGLGIWGAVKFFGGKK